jgi:polyribonucleotide nucleotidyltransferase
MVVGASEESVMMVEGEMKECSENEMIDAIKIAHDAIKNQISAQNNLVKKVGSKDIREYELEENDDELYKKISKDVYTKCYEIAKKGTKKEERSKKQKKG